MSPSSPLRGSLFTIRIGAGVPGLNNPRLGGVDIALVLDVLHADLDAVFGEDDVARGEAVLGILADLGGADVDLVAHEADTGHDEEQD